MQKQVRAAVVQAGSVVFDTGATLDKVERYAKDAASRNAELVVFPEAFVPGYPKGLGFGATIGARTAEGRDDYRRYYDSAIEIPGPATDSIAQLAADLEQYIVIGVIERDGGTLYCTVLYFSPDGLLGKHRKLMPTASERLVWGYGDGSTLPVFATPYGKLGAVICWENYMPLMRMAMFAQGIQIYCAPTADSRPTWASSMQHIACEGRCFVLSACQYLQRSDCPPEYSAVQGDDPETILMRGGSCIVDPFGNFLAGPVYDTTDLLIADLDLDEIARGKYDFDATGHYARPDVFQLHVNTSENATVRFTDGSFPPQEQ